MQRPTIRNWHIVIPGRLQNEGRPTAMPGLWFDLHAAHAGPDTAVWIRSWDCDIEAIAECIWRFRGSGDGPRVYLYGYSWGGMTCVLLARALMRRGIKVIYIVVSDAIYRYRYMLGNWRAFVPFVPIRIPCNVGAVYAFRQRISWPRGHDLVWDNGQPIEASVLNVPHRYMDDAKPFLDLAMDLAAIR